MILYHGSELDGDRPCESPMKGRLTFALGGGFL